MKFKWTWRFPPRDKKLKEMDKKIIFVKKNDTVVKIDVPKVEHVIKPRWRKPRIFERASGPRDGYVKTVLSKYGLGLTEFDEMVKAQSGECLICKKQSNLFVDHCHATGAVRGLLCTHCNSMLGFSRDRIWVLEAGIRYLHENKKEPKK
jgi:hypothetical protein